MTEENGHRTPYEKMVDLKDFVNAGTKKGSPDRFNVMDGDPRSILAMARSNDPFYCGQPSQWEAGEWFAKFHKNVGGRKTHIRFLFYVAVGQYKNPLTDEHEPFHLPDGTLLDKESEKDWNWFQDAAKWARNMKLVEPRLIVDKKKYQLHEHVARWEPDEPSFDISAPTILLPTGGTGLDRETFVVEAFGNRTRLRSRQGPYALDDRGLGGEGPRRG